MNRKLALALAAALLSVPSTSYAQNALLEIITPMDGETYPLTGSSGGGAIIEISIATRCFFDEYEFQWGVDGETLGNAVFVGHGTIQFSTKLGTGLHVVWANTDCEGKQAQFEVQ